MTRIAQVLACASLLVACASRAASRPPAPEPRGQLPAPVVSPAPAPVAPDAPAPSAVETPPAPPARLAWVNPARCAMPCTYDPEASLVRVDDQSVADSTGHHRVDRSIQEPLHALVTAARGAGHRIRLESAFRSYEDQERLFHEIKQVGRAARPGHSEHQLGVAVDLHLPTSAAIRWLAEHAHDYGFALSYPDGKQRITGYRPEPWHVRFVGQELAKELHDKAWTLEELFRARPELAESGACDDCPLPTSRPACGTITAEGACDGTVLQWCYDGALASVDCAVSKQRCGRARGARDYDCVAR